jgi:glycosyltransferase involved in cell wall biosynthesis
VHANLAVRLARLIKFRPAIISTAHSTYEAGSSVTIPREVTMRERLYRFTDGLGDLTTQVSRFGRDRYVRVRAAPRERIRWIPNGVDADRFVPNLDRRERCRRDLGIGSRFLWLAVGRHSEPKDYPTLLRSFAMLPESESVLAIAGTGPLERKTHDLVTSLNLQSRVKLLGFRSDIPDLMSAADGYVMSSIYEGLPMVLLEAGASGLPIVATNVGGNSEAILIAGNEDFNALVTPRSPDALAAAMHQTQHRFARLDHQTRLDIAQRVRMSYGLDIVASQWQDVYRELMHRRGLPTQS